MEYYKGLFSHRGVSCYTVSRGAVLTSKLYQLSHLDFYFVSDENRDFMWVADENPDGDFGWEWNFKYNNHVKGYSETKLKGLDFTEPWH